MDGDHLSANYVIMTGQPNKGPSRHLTIHLCFIRLGPSLPSTIWLLLTSCRCSWSLHQLWSAAAAHTDKSYTWVSGCESAPVLKPSRLQYLPSCGENHFCLGDIINTWLPLNCKSLSWAKEKQCEDGCLPVNNLSTQAMYAVLSTVGTIVFHLRGSIKRPCSSCAD